jgi:selenocysteine lyase/cysteine desulfurase
VLDNIQSIKIRSRFPIFKHKIYLNSCSQGALSDAVENGLTDYIRSWHEHGSPWDMWVEHYERTRRLFAEFIGADEGEVAIVTSASAAINAVASALDFRERRKVVLGEFEFPTMAHIWLAQRKRGADITFVPPLDNKLPAESYEGTVDRQTAIVPLTRVCFRNGFRSDVQAIVKLAHSQGAWVMLDDYQDCGTRPIDVKDMGIDFYVTGTLKYLLGPPGLAFLYVRRDLINPLIPAVSGWFAQSNPFAFDVKHLDLSSSARRFESGSPPIPNVYAAAPGIELLRSTGMAHIAGHISELTGMFLNSLAGMQIQTKTPADSVGPLVVLQADSEDSANAMVAALAKQNIVASSRGDGVRISLHFYNSADDIAALLHALERNMDLLLTRRVGSVAMES